jgi:hypothetical protein
MIHAPELQKGGHPARAREGFWVGKDVAAVKVAMNPAQQRRGLVSDPPREKENQPDPENQVQHLPGSPVRHKQEERSRPDDDPGMVIQRTQMPAPVIETGFYRTDQVTGSR